jgi:hypothetical protein
VCIYLQVRAATVAVGWYPPPGALHPLGHWCPDVHGSRLIARIRAGRRAARRARISAVHRAIRAFNGASGCASGKRPQVRILPGASPFTAAL